MKDKIHYFILIVLSVAILFSAATCGDDDDDDDSSSDGDGSADDTTADDATDDVTDDAADDTSDDTADDTATDDTGDDDTNGGPSILDTQHGDCKNGSGGEKEDYPESLEFSYADGVLTVKHVNGYFNCCLDDIEVTLSVDEDIITLYEQEIAANPCFCTCPFDVETQILWLEAGHYTVRVYVNGTLSITGETDV